MKLRVLFPCLLIGLYASAQFTVDPNFGFGDEPYFFTDNGTVDIYHDCVVGENDHIYFTGWSNTFNSLVLGSVNAEGDFNLDYAPAYNRLLAVPDAQQANGYRIAMRSDNTPVIGGIYVPNGADYSSLFVLGANAMGMQDPDFGDLGTYQFSDGSDCFLGDILVTEDDGVFILGRLRFPGNGDYLYLVIKLDASGQLDPSFEGEGILTFNAGDSNRYLNTGLLLDDGSLLVGGASNSRQIAKILPDGSLDATFGSGGYIDLPNYVEIESIYQNEDGFYALGSEAGFNAHLYKFDETGLDLSYGEDGVANLGFPGFTKDAFFNEEGQVYFTGFNQGISYVTRATLDGNLDPTFFENDSPSFESFDNNLALFTCTELSDGSIVAAGNAIDLVDSGSGEDFVAYKLSDSQISVSEEDFTVHPALFPNPVRHTCQITSGSVIQRVLVYDMMGQLLIEAQPNQKTITLNTEQWVSGTYSVQIISEAGIGFKKLVKK